MCSLRTVTDCNVTPACAWRRLKRQLHHDICIDLLHTYKASAIMIHDRIGIVCDACRNLDTASYGHTGCTTHERGSRRSTSYCTCSRDSLENLQKPRIVLRIHGRDNCTCTSHTNRADAVSSWQTPLKKSIERDDSLASACAVMLSLN